MRRCVGFTGYHFRPSGKRIKAGPPHHSLHTAAWKALRTGWLLD